MDRLRHAGRAPQLPLQTDGGHPDPDHDPCPLQGQGVPLHHRVVAHHARRVEAGAGGREGEAEFEGHAVHADGELVPHRHQLHQVPPRRLHVRPLVHGEPQLPKQTVSPPRRPLLEELLEAPRDLHGGHHEGRGVEGGDAGLQRGG